MLGAGGVPHDCTLREVWRTGALLRFQVPVEVLPEFVLHLAHDGRVARKCRVTSRSADGCEIEVEFVARRVPASGQRRIARVEPQAAYPATASLPADKASLAC
jgi:hypothetical protein